MKVLWWSKTLWKKNMGLDKCVRPPSNSLISSPYASDPGSSYLPIASAQWDAIVFSQAQIDRIKAGTGTAQSIAQEMGGVYTGGNNANYPGCGSAMQCKKR